MNPTTHEDPLAWIRQLDGSLLALERMTRTYGGIKDGDTRPYCEAWVSSGHLCSNLAKDETPYCRTHIKSPPKMRTEDDRVTHP